MRRKTVMDDPSVSIYLPPSMRHFQPRHLPTSDWHVHLPLAYDLTEALRPQLLVALGTCGGATYHSFCQSVLEHGLDALCYAVGLWEKGQGEHSGDDLYQDFSACDRQLYSGFSYALRMSFTQALNHFDDETVDLIHIDEDCPASEVPAEISRWYPKLRSGGMLVLHDIGKPGSELRSFWDKQAGEHEAFTFGGEPALGLMRKPGVRSEAEPQLLRSLFGSDSKDQETLRAIYSQAARYLELDQAVGRPHFGRMVGERHSLEHDPR